MRHARHVLATVVLVLSLVCVVGVDDVSAAATIHGTLRGQVVDEQNAPLAGVTVIVRSQSLVREMAVQTDGDGIFFVSGLAPGDYAVVARLAGFIPMQQNTTVQVDKVTVLNYKLTMGELMETVVVTAERPLVSKTATEGAYNLRKDFTETIPIPRSYQSLLQLAPGVSNTAEEDGNPNMLGGTRNANSYLLDGVSVTDPVTGTFGSNINYDSIEEYDIKLTGVSAEYGGFDGGVSNVISKSGGNDFTGSFRNIVTSPSFQSERKQSTLDEFYPDDRPDEVQARGEKELSNEIETTLGGPIIRNNAWFFISYQRNDTSSLQTIGNPTGGPFGNGTYVRNFEGDNTNGKLTWQVTNNHKLQYNYFEDPATVPRCYGQLFWGGPCYDTAFVDFQSQGGNASTGTWNAIWSNKIFSDVRIGHWENSFDISSFTPPTIRPDLVFESPGGLGAGLAAGHAPTIDLSTGSLFDAPIFGPFPEVRERDNYEAKVTAFLPTGKGSHTLKIGADYQEQTRVGASVLAGNGLIYMDGFVNPPPGLGGDGDPYDINNRIYAAFYDYSVPADAGPVTKETALFAQDDWVLNDHFAFNLGLRIEQFSDENDIGEKVIDQTGFAPRLGGTYDITGSGKYLVKATAARYLSSVKLTTLSPFVRAAGGQSAYDIYVNIDTDTDGNPNPGPPTWGLIGQVRPDPETSGFSPDLEPTSVDEFTVGYEHALSPNWGLKVRLISREWDNIVSQNFTYDYDTDGTPSQILFMDNKDAIKRKYRAAILEFEKRYANNWTLRGSAVFSEAEGNTTVDTGFDTYDSFAGVPQTTENRYGSLAFEVDTAFKLFGSYRIPLKSNRHMLEVGGFIDWAAGNRYSGTQSVPVVVGPGPDGIQDVDLGESSAGESDDQIARVTAYFTDRGAFQEEDNWYYLDFQTRYQFVISKSISLEARIDIRNITDEQTPLSVNTNYNTDGTPQDNFGYPLAWSQFQRPRNYRFNMAIIW